MLPSSWENYAVQEATVRTGHGTTDWFQIWKGVRQGCILSSYLFNLYAEYIMQNAGLDKGQAGIKISRRNINNLRYADDTTLMAESEELKSLLMKVKEQNEKVGLKLNIQKMITASGPITSWQIDGEIMETVEDFVFLGSKITADGDCNHEIKRCLLLGRKAMTNLDSILKSRDINWPTKFCPVKAMVFSSSHLCMWELDYKAEHWRIDAFELWCWRRLLRVPWTARRSNQSILSGLKSILNIHWKDWCWNGNSNTWATWCKNWLIGNDPDAGKDWRQETGMTEDEMVGWHHWLNGQIPGVSDGQGSLACCSSWGHKESDMTEWLNWTKLKSQQSSKWFIRNQLIN